MAEEKVTKATEETADIAEKTSGEKKAKTTSKKLASAEKKQASGKVVKIKAAEKECPKDKAPKKACVRIILRRSLTGRSKAQIAVAASLGLRRVGDVTFQPDNAATQGKISKIVFLLDVRKA